MYKLKSKIYVKNSAKEPGKAAEIRENLKIKIYENLSDHYYFEPVCVETLCSWGPRHFTWLKPNQNNWYTQKFTKSEILELNGFVLKAAVLRAIQHLSSAHKVP